jgi:hypothetical protein
MVFAVLLTLAVAGCGRPTPPAAVPTATVSVARVSTAVPYVLYTHCGIDEARLDNHYDEAIDPLSDGNGNPPAGWDNPFQKGTMHQVPLRRSSFRTSTDTTFCSVFVLRQRASSASAPNPVSQMSTR